MRSRRGLFIVVALAVVPVLLVVYVSVAAILSALFPLKSLDADQPGIDILLVSNGMHVDLGLPLDHPATPCWARRAQSHVENDAYDFVLIGWGDREFYLNTPHWEDVRFSHAWDALFGSEASVVHLVFIQENWLREGRYRKVRVSESQLNELLAYMREVFSDERSGIDPVIGVSYGSNDVFLHSRGTYNAFLTCNAWLGRALNRAEVTANPWTPFAWNLVGAGP